MMNRFQLFKMMNRFQLFISQFENGFKYDMLKYLSPDPFMI